MDANDNAAAANETPVAIDRRRRAVELARLALEEEEVQLKRAKLRHEREQLEQQSASILRLNVGGKHFDTTRETLLGVGSSFFRRLLDEPAEQTAAGDVAIRGAMRDAAGRLFIDRSPDGFRLVLEWCRGNGDVGVYDDATRSLLLHEAMYYDLPRLVAQLQVRGYDPSLLSLADQEIRNQAATLRLALAEGREGAAAEADAALIPVFDLRPLLNRFRALLPTTRMCPSCMGRRCSSQLRRSERRGTSNAKAMRASGCGWMRSPARSSQDSTSPTSSLRAAPSCMCLC